MRIGKILVNFHNIAVVGLSSNKQRPSYGVGRYMKEHGYRIIPVNPKEEMILGERCYPSLLSIDEQVDIVDVFRRSEEVADVVDEAIRIGAKVVWMQEDVVNEEAASMARDAGIEVVMDKCIKKEHQRLVGEEPLPYGVCEVRFDDES
ncbi:MAG: CoA-binding protein [Chloroflexota bacterium]|nr:CoA-binding protein [Chloroflexota bacterium]